MIKILKVKKANKFFSEKKKYVPLISMIKIFLNKVNKIKFSLLQFGAIINQFRQFKSIIIMNKEN
jgi:hypothetical protein